MDRSQDQNRIVEYLRIKPISHSQIYTSQIAIPDSLQKEIFRDRREALRRSLIEQGSNLIPLIVRRTEAYSNEEEYEVVCGADWYTIATELGIDQMWAWVFEMSDEEVVAAQAEMALLAPQATQKAPQIETLFQQFELSLQQKVESLTKQIEQSVKRNEDLLKKQVKALTQQNIEHDQIEQMKSLIAKVEQTFNAKVDKLAKKIEKSGNDNPPTSAVSSEMNLEGALTQLDDLEQSLSIKLERTIEIINQFVVDAIKDVEDDLKNQIETLRSQLGSDIYHSEIQREVQPKIQSKTQSKKQSKAQAKPQLPQLQLEFQFESQSESQSESPLEDYDSCSLRRLKAIGKDRKVRGYARMKRPELLVALKQIDGK